MDGSDDYYVVKMLKHTGKTFEVANLQAFQNRQDSMNHVIPAKFLLCETSTIIVMPRLEDLAFPCFKPQSRQELFDVLTQTIEVHISSF